MEFVGGRLHCPSLLPIKLNMYEERLYRKDFAKDWYSYEICVKETDLLVQSKEKLDEQIIYRSVKNYRKELEDYIRNFPEIKSSLSSFSLKEPAPSIIKDMVEKSSLVGIGPMASVAGAIAEYVGKDLLEFTCELVVENGGDIFMKKRGDILLGLYAGEASFINNFLLRVENKDSCMGICSSSSFLGHSLSLGRADLSTVISESAVFADAMATKLTNMVKDEKDIDAAIQFCKKFSLSRGVVVVKRDKLGIWGEVELLRK